jgi:hypothetical protein
MENRAIEIHDSVLEHLSIVDGRALFEFSSLYVHQSIGTPGADPGTGWFQRARLQINGAMFFSSFSEFPCKLLGGQISLGGSEFDNVIPIPLLYRDGIALRLDSRDGAVIQLRGTDVELELMGEPHHVEEFRPSRSD